jgi:hypothetical protein
MIIPTSTDTIADLVRFAEGRDVPSTTMALERNGVIIGGIIIITGEKNFETVKSILPTKKVGRQCPDASPVP